MPLDDNPLIASLSERVRGMADADHGLGLRLGECRLHVALNTPELTQRLADYFESFLDTDTMPDPDIAITALEMAEPDLGLDFADWPRDAGKAGRKDSYIDLADGRACRKVRTTMQYLMGGGEHLVFGPCLENDNQVVNFIISQYISWLVNRDWALCHASALLRNGHGIAFAAFSGGGKSTLALHLMPEGFDFVSNDRLLIRLADDGAPQMRGVPKQPRINPGTVLNNPALSTVIDAGRRSELAALPTDELWDLEEKYDADIGSLFGVERFRLDTPIQTFLILNWKRDIDQDTAFSPVSLRERPDLLAAVMKSPGPFHMDSDGVFSMGENAPDPKDYLPILDGIQVFEVTGRTDFTAAKNFILKKTG